MTNDTALSIPEVLNDAEYPVGVAIASLGMAPCHTLESKFAALQSADLKYTEMCFGEYIKWVRSELPDLPTSTCRPDWAEEGEPDPEADEEIWAALVRKAPDMLKLLKSYGLKLLGIQRLNQYEGWPEIHERSTHVKRKAHQWIRVCEALHVDWLQLGSNNLQEANAPDSKWAADLRYLAQLGAESKPPVKIVYEPWCFSPIVNDWERTWEIIRLADHPNLGLLYDTAQAPLAPNYGWNPRTGEGWTNTEFAAMLERLKAVPPEKIFLLELSDALAPSPPLGQGSAFDVWAANATHGCNEIFSWACCGRPVPFIGRDVGRGVASEADCGQARVLEQVKVLIENGYKGPMMFEMFEAQTMEKDDPTIPALYADACKESHRRLRKLLQLKS